MFYNGIQYNTPHFQINPEMYGLQNIPHLLWGLDLLGPVNIKYIYTFSFRHNSYGSKNTFNNTFNNIKTNNYILLHLTLKGTNSNNNDHCFALHI